MTAPTQQQPPRQLTPQQLALLLALVQAQAATRQQLTQAAVAGALAPLRVFTAWWDAAAVNRLIVQILRVVQPAQRQAARLTDAYMAQATSIITGTPARTAGPVDVTKLRRKMTPQLADEILAGHRPIPRIELGNSHDGPSQHIDAPARMAFADHKVFHTPAEAYGRVADGYRYAVVAKGDTEEKAQQRAQLRMELIVATDVTLAVREQYRKSLGNLNGVTGWRRILHPELSKTGPCALCVVAADRVYKKEDLLPLHNFCVCEVLPVIGKLDPGFTLNGDDLSRLYDAAGGNTREALRRVSVVLTEHAELGPILVDGAQHYRGPREVAKTQTTDDATRYRAQLDALEKSFESLQIRHMQGDQTVEKGLRWQHDRIEELHRLIGASA